MKKIALTLIICFVGIYVLSGGIAPKAEAATGIWYDVPGVVGGQVKFDKSTGTITEVGDSSGWISSVTIAEIPSSIDGVSVTKIGDSAFQASHKLTKVILPVGITEIGVYAFSNCINLIEINIPDGVEKIGNSAFNGCKDLLKIYIPDSVTTMGMYIFSQCESLVEANIPHGITRLDGVFRGCSSLESIIIPDSMEILGESLFDDCTSLKEITIPNSVNDIYSAFRGCTSLVTVDIPDSVTSISYRAFQNCENLETINIGSGINTSLQGSIFDGCNNLTEINISSNNNEYTTIDGVLFTKSQPGSNIQQLVRFPNGKEGSYIVPESVNSIGSDAFKGAKKLNSVVFQRDEMSIFAEAFMGCTNLTSVTFPKAASTKYGYGYYISDNAFNDCPNLEFVYFEGTKDEWELNNFTTGNENLTDAKIVYQSLGAINSGDGNSELEVGETIDIATFDLPEQLKGKTLILESSNNLVASVNGTVVTAENVGDVVVSIKAGESNLSYTYIIKVIPPDLGLDENSLDFGTTQGTANGDGPSVDIAGEEFSLFSSTLAVEAGHLNKIFDYKLEYDHINKISTATYSSKKLGFKKFDDISTDHEQIKELISSYDEMSIEEFSEKFDSIVNNNGENKWDLGFEFDVIAMAYLEYDHKTGIPLFQEGGMLIQLDMKLGVNYYFPPYPKIYVQVGIESTANGGFKLVVEDISTTDTSVNVEGALEATLKPYIKLVFDAWVVEAAAKLEGELKFSYKFIPGEDPPLEDIMKLQMSAGASFEWRTLVFFSGVHSFNWPYFDIYPKEKEDETSGRSINPMAMNAPISDDTFVIDEIEMKPMPRTSEFMNMSQMQRMSPMSLSATNNQTTINSNIFQNAEPSLITANGITMAVFEMDEASRASGDRTMLYYSVKTESGWSAISPVEDDGTADFAPQLFAINDEIYVLWNNGVTILGEISTVEETVANLTLRVAKFDGTGFVGATNVSTPNGKFAVAVDVATNGTTANISWVENSLNSVFDFEGSYTIKSATYDGTSFGTVQEIYNSAYPITNIVGGYNAGSYVLSFIESVYNGNLLQSSSVNLFENGTVTPLSVTTDRKSNLDILNETAFWIENGNATIVDLAGVEPLKTILLEDAALIQRANLIENNAGEHALIYSAGENYHSEIYVRYQQGEEFTQPIQLTKDGKAASVSGVDFNDEDELNVLFTSTAINDNPPSGSSAFGQTELRFLTNTNEIDLQIVGEPYFDPAQVVPNQELPVTINVKNNSSVTVSSMRVSLRSGYFTSYNVVLQPGETKAITLNYAVPPFIVQSTINIEIRPATGDDANALDNATTTDLFYRDIEISGYEVDGDQATVTIKNNSVDVVSNITVELLDKNLDGNVLQSQNIASMNAGEIKTVVFTLTNAVEIVDVYDVSYYYVNAFIAEPENIYANNFMATPKVPKRVESITLINDEITIAKGESAKLQATVLPADALNTDVFWVSSDESVATIDENGNVQGLKRGEITVTAVTKDNALMTTAFVNVTSTGSFISGEISSYDPKKEVSINLFDKDDDARETPLYTSKIPADISGSGLKVQPFDVQDVLPGTYDMVISKQGHASVTVTDIVVADTDIVLTESLNVALKSIWLPAGDINGDGWVNFEDILIAIYVTNYGQQIGASGANPSADVTGDEWINFEDLLVLIYVLNYGKGDIFIPFS